MFTWHVSNEVKVGVTRNRTRSQPVGLTRGQAHAIKLAKTPNRHIAGIIEVFLKKYFTDKTNWRAMLQNNINHKVNLLAEKEKALSLLPSELQKYQDTNKRYCPY